MRTGRMALVESLLPAYVIEVARDPDSSVQMLNLPEIFDLYVLLFDTFPHQK